jgi:hypothetical protein
LHPQVDPIAGTHVKPSPQYSLLQRHVPFDAPPHGGVIWAFAPHCWQRVQTNPSP